MTVEDNVICANAVYANASIITTKGDCSLQSTAFFKASVPGAEGDVHSIESLQLTDKSTCTVGAQVTGEPSLHVAPQTREVGHYNH